MHKEDRNRPDLIPVRLSWKQWLIVLPVWLAFLGFGPRLWERCETFEPGKDYRIAAGLRDDYALFSRWSRIAAREYPALVIGDSAIWGRYVDREDTLPAQLNRRLEEPYFANFGVDGLHNVAVVGLLRHYGGAVRNKRVLLQFNPLWMQSKRQDLTGDKEFPVNHPRLLPQFDRTLKCYRAGVEERLSVWAERSFPFSSLMNHIVLNYYENLGLQHWMARHPYRCPVEAIDWHIPTDPARDGRADDTTSNWEQRDLRRQNWRWVALEQSRQWAAFKEILSLLESRGNRVFVLVGPFNPYIMEKESLGRYRALRSQIEAWLRASHPDYHVALDLRTEEYGDASHPLAPGYRRVAQALCEDKRFQAWLKE